MQSSITAWLKKPLSVKQPQPPSSASPNKTPTNPALPTITSTTDTTTLPTPSPGEQELSQRSTSSTPSSLPPNPSQPPFAKPSLQPLSPNLTLEPCTATRLAAFKHLNALLLQIPYPNNFYTEILSDSTASSITLLAIWRDNPLDTTTPGRVVGGIRCRLLGRDTLLPNGVTTSNAHAATKGPLLYISTLTVLSAYRQYGIATHLLERVLRTAIEDFEVGAVGAHVWVLNQEGRDWYKKRGFREERTEEAYYRRLKPPGAVVVRRAVGVGDLLGK